MLDELSVLSWWLSPQATIDEPETAVAGDSWQWKKILLLYPASKGYTLAYYFANATSAFSIAGAAITAVGDTFVIDFAATAAAIAPGKYRWQAYATLAGVRTTAVEGWLVVTPDLSLGTPIDARTPARALLDAIDTLLAGRTLTDTAKYTIGNRSLEKLDPIALMNARSRIAWRVFHEQRAERTANGLDDGKRLYVRFDRG
jgi:hypothetical protein